VRWNAKGILSLLRGRAEDLPLPNASIDSIASNYAFHHFGDKDRALDEVHRALTERALEDAERRVVSQLALLEDAHHQRGLARLRADAAAEDAMVTTTRSRLQLTARRTS
jgi:ubiquinone/menaquinone biosynthesis C-methylase UbiE